MKLQQSHKLFYTDIYVSDDASQSASVQFLVIGNNDLRERIVTTQDYMTATLPFQSKSNFAECSGAVPS